MIQIIADYVMPILCLALLLWVLIDVLRGRYDGPNHSILRGYIVAIQDSHSGFIWQFRRSGILNVRAYIIRWPLDINLATSYFERKAGLYYIPAPRLRSSFEKRLHTFIDDCYDCKEGEETI